jgi:hypothetical protein
MTSWPQGPRKKHWKKKSFLVKVLNCHILTFSWWWPWRTQLTSNNFKSLTRNLSYSSFFSVLCPDLKNEFFGKIHWDPSEILEVKRPFSRSWRPNFGFCLFIMGFHLEFSLFWVSRSFDLSNLSDLKRGSGNFFKNYIFEISAFQQKIWVTASWSKISLNLSTEEVWEARTISEILQSCFA